MPLAGELYDSFLTPDNDRGEINYIAGDVVTYPTSDQINIFGPLYLPRVYGKDLTAFEIASSGAVAVTLNDIHSFDLTRDNPTSNIVLQTYSNDSFNINVADSNMYLSFATSNNTITMWSDSNITVHAEDTLSLEANTLAFVIGENFNVDAKNINLTADSNVNITGVNGLISLSASNDNITFLMADDNATLFALNDVSITASNDLWVAANSNVYITASNADLVLSANQDEMNMTFDASTSNITVRSTNGFLVTTDGQINMTSTNESVILRAAANDVKIELDSATSNLNIYAISNITIDAKSKLTMTSSNECAITAGKSITMTTGSNMTVTASNDISITAESNVNIEAETNSLNLTAAFGKVYVKLDAPTKSLYMSTSNNIEVSASNDIDISAGRDATFIADSNLTLTGASNVTVQRDAANSIVVKDDDTIVFTTGGADVITAYNDRVHIKGDVMVTGVIDSVDIHQSNLMIADKTINLAFDPNNSPLPDGELNTGAGVIVSGQYGGASNARSLLWNWNEGMQHLGTPNVDDESFWDLRGGQLRITHSNATKEIAFGFRINEFDELELVKKTNAGTFKRIAKFGRTLV